VVIFSGKCVHTFTTNSQTIFFPFSYGGFLNLLQAAAKSNFKEHKEKLSTNELAGVLIETNHRRSQFARSEVKIKK
jgi:hypothetical protein